LFRGARWCRIETDANRQPFSLYCVESEIDEKPAHEQTENYRRALGHFRMFGYFHILLRDELGQLRQQEHEE
jgi:hypothetical protein